MVQAILAGSKTQTRRICKNHIYGNGISFDKGSGDLLCHNDYLPPSAMLMDVRRGGVSYTTSDLEGWTSECPYGQPGDRLWVKETGWQPREPSLKELREGADTWPKYSYDADGIDDYDREQFKEWGWKRRPSIFMPRWASRITLELMNVRVERLQDISEADAKAEGVEPYGDCYCVPYRRLWESINGSDSWKANPWVWVVEFRRVDATLPNIG
jgi:hypothetical protein